jgi:DNA-binding transcriptional ArsR family regulator
MRAWAIPQPGERGRELLDPREFRAVLLELLDAIWDGWLERAWAESLPQLRASVAATPPPPGCSGVQWISLVTGLRPDNPYAAAADSATELVVLPTPGLGRSLSLFADQLTWVVFTPQESPTPRQKSKRTGISVGRLAALAPVMRALGDRTRLALTLHLLEHGPMTMQQLADALEVHQSTVSRQVNALREAGVVRIQDDRRVVAVSGVVRQACQTLLAAVD